MGIALPGYVQVAGVIDQAEADLIVEARADMLGFPLGLKDGREDLSVPQAAEIIRNLPLHVASVCITYHARAAEVLGLCERLGASWVQLHGAIEAGEIRKMRNAAPDLGVIKSLIVRGGNTTGLLDEVAAYGDLVDAYITDTFDPDTGRSGATGKTHDWAISRAIVEASPVPVILAGGLTPDNVHAAVAAVKPAAVDVHSGVEGLNGRKDSNLLRQFVKRSRAALGKT